MARLVTCGWETGDINEIGSGSGAIATSTPSPRTPGTYYIKFQLGSNQSGNRTVILPSALTELWIRVGVYPFYSSLTNLQDTVLLQDSAGQNQLSVAWHGGDNFLRVYRQQLNGPLLATSSLPMTASAWHTLEIRWKATTTTSSADGIVEVWVDGARFVDLPAVDNTNTSNLNVQRVQLNAQTSSSQSATFGFDDWAINDTSGSINNGQIGDGRVVLLKPNGAGSNTNQTRGGTDSGANWSQVDELPTSMTDYVYSAIEGTRDTYSLEDIPAGSWSVNCVQVLAYGMNSDALPGSLGLTIKSGATTNEGAAQSLTSSAMYVRQLYETDPNTSAAWTNAAVNALEAGTTVR